MSIPNSIKKKYISFSLWGSQPIYCIGALKNIELAKLIYNDWVVIIYYDDTVPQDIIELINSTGTETIKITDKTYGMFWRFYAADLPDCEVAIFRDCDSRLSWREKFAVDKWLKSGNAIHVMRDHPYHEIPFGTDKSGILGGMWGIKGNLISISIMIQDYIKNNITNYGSDQAFLAQIFTMFQNSATIHDDFFSKKKFPKRRRDYRFVGERIDEHDMPVGNDWEVIKTYYHECSMIFKIKNKIKRYIGKH